MVGREYGILRVRGSVSEHRFSDSVVRTYYNGIAFAPPDASQYQGFMFGEAGRWDLSATLEGNYLLFSITTPMNRISHIFESSSKRNFLYTGVFSTLVDGKKQLLLSDNRGRFEAARLGILTLDDKLKGKAIEEIVLLLLEQT